MPEDPIQPTPPRLAEEASAAGELLRGAERAFETERLEAEAWEKLKRRGRRRAVVSWVPMVAALGVASAALLSRGRFRNRVETIDVEPDRTQIGVVERRGETPNDETPDRAPKQEPAALAERIDREPAVRPPPLARDSGPPSEASCRRLSAAGNIDRSIECFRVLGQGATVDADIALYQAAKLSFDRRRDARRALSLLDEYKRRFPEGAMRGEVDWLRVQAWERMGKLDEALGESEKLLATPTGRTLSSELHMVRGRIYQDGRGDCARATSEFVALVGEPGPLGDEAELRRAGCLEKLGRADDAAAAYSQYLHRDAPSNAAKARERLQALRAPGEPEARP